MEMEHFVITIGREFGSQGREIAEKLGELLGIPVYDKNVIEIGAHQKCLPRRTYEYADKLIEEKLNGYGTGKFFFNSSYVTQMYELQAETIKDLAKKGSCVFVGRCADYVLKDRKNCLHVFIFASYSERYYHLLNEYGLTDEQTKRMITKVDRARHEYYKHFTGMNRGDRSNKNLLIDSGVLGVDGTVQLLKNIVVEKFKK